MDVIKAIHSRRSIRKYTNKQVSEEQVEILLKAAMHAPSAVNKQPWHFIVFSNAKIKEEIIVFHPNAWMLKEAPVGILVCYDENLQHDTGYGEVDCGAATQNILLAAHGIGLGSVWIGIYPRQQRIVAICELFKLPSHIKPFSVVAVGYPDEKQLLPDRFRKERIHYERW
ncbi:MAG: nitroreductase family protein [Bacteroidales bacterium]|nr:nitroreductase family protein [Bacteroidales bacterium]